MAVCSQSMRSSCIHHNIPLQMVMNHHPSRKQWQSGLRTFERQGPQGWWVYCKRACNLHPMHASLRWMRRELCWRRMCKKSARMAFTITSTSKNESCSQSGRGQLPPSVRKMSTLALDMYNSTTYETHCRFESQGQVELSLPLGKSTCWSSRVEMMHSILTHYKGNLNRFHRCTVCVWLL
jgi:hypothetical protein